MDLMDSDDEGEVGEKGGFKINTDYADRYAYFISPVVFDPHSKRSLCHL